MTSLTFFVFLQNVLLAARKAFDVFFLRYPYCYGYWKKYADIEKKHGNIQAAEEVKACVNLCLNYSLQQAKLCLQIIHVYFTLLNN